MRHVGRAEDALTEPKLTPAIVVVGGLPTQQPATILVVAAGIPPFAEKALR
jgi:hypothetical protein